MNVQQIVRLALKERSPELYDQLDQAGKLRAFVEERADQILEYVADKTGNDPRVRKAWSPESKLSIVQRAALANSVQQEVLSIALDAFLDFPRDATSRPRPGVTSPSAPTT